MKRSIILAALFGCAAILQAAVTPFSYYTRPDGSPLLIPAVREYKAGEGVVKFPAEVAVSVPKGEELIAEQIAGEFKRFPEIKVSAKTETVSSASSSPTSRCRRVRRATLSP